MAVVFVAPDSIDVEHTARVGTDIAEALGDVQSLAGFRTYHGMIVIGASRGGRFTEGLALRSTRLCARRAEFASRRSR